APSPTDAPAPRTELSTTAPAPTCAPAPRTARLPARAPRSTTAPGPTYTGGTRRAARSTSADGSTSVKSAPRASPTSVGKARRRARGGRPRRTVLEQVGLGQAAPGMDRVRVERLGTGLLEERRDATVPGDTNEPVAGRIGDRGEEDRRPRPGRRSDPLRARS